MQKHTENTFDACVSWRTQCVDAVDVMPEIAGWSLCLWWELGMGAVHLPMTYRRIPLRPRIYIPQAYLADASFHSLIRNLRRPVLLEDLEFATKHHGSHSLNFLLRELLQYHFLNSPLAICSYNTDTDLPS